jgi:hypothetical protein
MSGSFPGARVVISEDDMGLSVDPCMADSEAVRLDMRRSVNGEETLTQTR